MKHEKKQVFQGFIRCLDTIAKIWVSLSRDCTKRKVKDTCYVYIYAGKKDIWRKTMKIETKQRKENIAGETELSDDFEKI